MRQRLIVMTALFALSVDSPPPAAAGSFSTLATEYTQLLNHAELVLQYLRQGEQLANELKMYADMLRNSGRLGGHTFGPISSAARSVKRGSTSARV